MLIKKNTKINFTIAILLFVHINIYGQTNTTQTVNWESLKKSTSNINNGKKQLPSIDGKIQHQNQQSTLSIHIANITTSVIDTIELTGYCLDSMSDDFKIETYCSTERKITYTYYYITPIRYNSNNNQYELLESYNLQIDSKNNAIYKTSKSATTQIESALKTGNWYKIKVDKSGVYQLTYNQLKEIGLSDPENVRVYGYGGDQLSFYNDDFSYDDMIENSIFMNKGADNIFNSGDYILFYSNGPLTWKYNERFDSFEHHIHNYSKYIYLFLSDSFGEGLRIKDENNTSTPDYTTNQTDEHQVYHNESINLVKSGNFWFSDLIRSGSSMDYTFNFKNRLPNEPIKMYLYSAGHKANETSSLVLKVTENNTLITTATTSSSYDTYVYAYPQTSVENFYPSSNNFTLKCTYSGSNAIAEGYIGYIRLSTRSSLSFSGGQYSFRDTKSISSGKNTQFNITNNGTAFKVWDITNATNPVNMVTNTTGTQTSFIANTETYKEFIAFDVSSYLSPIISADDLGMVANQNLHGVKNCDFMIVCHPDFMDQAKELAEIRKAEPYNLNVYITTPQQIYNEFSSGTPDASAIRNYMRYLYNNAENTNHLIKYLLLIGDGSYDNKEIKGFKSTYIPTYESENSTSESSSYVTDDFYGMLDPGEGSYYGSLDIGVGRFPVSTPEDAQIIIDKIKNYESVNSMGNWRSRICFISDDEDRNLYLSNAEELSNYIILPNHPEYNIEKIYFDAYKQESTPAGERYPTVTEAINNVVKKGALIINYIGHGNPHKLGHEDVLLTSDVRKWKNYNKLAVFLTASCEVGRFDDHEITSFGEWIILNPDGGGIAAFTTTRVVYGSSNQVLNSHFFKQALNPNLSLGDIIKIAKNNTNGPGDTNKRNFSLLGDPSMKLHVPYKKALVTKIDKVPVSIKPVESENNNLLEKKAYMAADTITALSTVKLSGYLIDSTQDLISNNGTLYCSVYDKASEITSRGNNDTPKKTFEVQNSILYKGQASITNGFFEFEFMIPKDINYTVGLGKISIYAILDDGTDANGYSNDILVGGSSKTAIKDFVGPEISLYMNDTTFINGDITNENPVLLAKLIDDYGINTSGNGIGHNITAIIDGNDEKTIILNDFYEGELNKYNCGNVKYPLTDIAPGHHTITFKAWDINNNSSVSEIGFYVQSSSDIIIDELRNAPNPFYDETTFIFKHNQAEKELKVTIHVYDIMGKLVSTITQSQNNGSFTISPIFWDGRTNNGVKLAKGVYIYNAEISTIDGKKTNKSSKLMIFK